jgi:glycine/D-amino acid oxidase-like deaminating enzyme
MTPFPISAAAPPAFPDPPPARAAVVVIGAGVIGICAALFLARRGVEVVVVEKGRVAAEQSSRNWGWIRKQGRDPAELPIMIEASRLWEDLAAEAGADIGFRRRGVLYLARRPKDIARFEAWMAHARAHQLDTRLLSAREVAELVPGHAAGWIGGIFTASDARAEPWVAVPALARLAARSGVRIAEGCAARALDLAAGRVAGVITERGRIAADAVVLAGGAWSALFLGRHGVRLPQLSVRASVAATAPLPEVFAGNASDGRFAFRRRADGGYTLAPSDFHEFFVGPAAFAHARAYWPQLRADPFGTRFLPAAPAGYPDAWGTPRHWPEEGPSPFERMRVLDPAPNRRRVARLARQMQAAFPGLPPVTLRAAWAGMIDTMPDVVPVIDHVPALPGLTLATGMSGHGFGIGPGVGRVVADLVTGRPPGHDLARFRFGRFSDGSPIRPGPAL